MKLFYGSFERILYKYYGEVDIDGKKISTAMFSRTLLGVGADDYLRFKIDGLDDSVFSTFHKGSVNVYDYIVACYMNPNIRDYVVPYFAENITKHIGKECLADLLRDLLDLIASDGDIAYEQKKAFEQMAKPGTLNEFLAEVFIYAIKQKSKPQRNVKFPFKYLPYERNTFFTARESFVKELHDNFHNAIRMQTLSGLGGIGKTQIALEYAHQFAGEYDVVWWIDSESAATMIKSFTLFLERQKCMPECSDAALVREAFLEWFDTHSSWLLIYDNIDYGSQVESCNFETYLPKNSDVGHIVLTTRCNTAYRDEPLVLVEEFDEQCAVEFLIKRTKIADEKNAVTIAKRLGYLPLALEQAGAYIVENKAIGLEGYLELLDDWGLELLENNGRLTNYKLAVAATWRLSMHKIQTESAHQLLYLCSYLSPNSIDVDFFVHAKEFEYLQSSLADEIAHPLKRNKIITELTRYSLCSYDGQCLSMHSLLQEVILTTIAEVSKENYNYSKEYMLTCFGTVFNMCDFEFDGEDAAELAPHAVSVIGHFISFLDETDEDLIKKLRSINSWLLNYSLFYDADGRVLKMLDFPLKIIEKRLNRGAMKKLRKSMHPNVLSALSSFDLFPLVEFAFSAFQGENITETDMEIMQLWFVYWLLETFERSGMMPELKEILLRIFRLFGKEGTEAFQNDPFIQLILALFKKNMPDNDKPKQIK